MRRLVVKVCGMRNAENVRSVGALAPDLMGFIFVPESPRYVGPRLDPVARSAVPSSVKVVGVFQNAPVSEVVATVRDAQLAAVQLHGSESISYVRELKAQLADISVLKAASIRTGDDLSSLGGGEGVIDYYLFDGKQAGSGEPFDWSLLSRYKAQTPFFVAGGVGLENVVALCDIAAADPRFVGIDINSRVEDAPGIKNIAMVGELLSKVRV